MKALLIALLLTVTAATAIPMATAAVNTEMQDRIAAWHQARPQEIRWSRCTACHK